jgi:ABC-type dipeptide/oligopeptide/nickel transport system permease component
VPAPLRYALFRIGLAVPVLVGIVTVTFFVTHSLPTNPAVIAAGSEADRETLKAIEHQLGLDRPLGVQYVDFLGGLLHGNLGLSIRSGRGVTTELLARLPSTLELITLAIPLAFLIGLGFAMLAADRQGGVRDGAGRVVGTVGIAIPDYILGLLLILVLFGMLHWVPAPLGQSGPAAPHIARVTGAYFVDSLLAGDTDAIGSGLSHLILPVTALAVHYASAIYRVARAALEEAKRSRYVDYATIMGGSPGYVWRAVVANALPPVLTITGVIYGQLLGGAVLIEVVFGWGGMGQFAIESILNNDYPAVQGFVLAAATFSVIVFLIVDLVHAGLDPRVRARL